MKSEPMNADEFYNWMKNALDFLGLEFYEKEKMNLKFKQNEIVASYKNEEIRFKVEEEK